MAKPIRLGLIGCGGIVQLVHARAYLSLRDTVKVVALADVLEENLQQIGQTLMYRLISGMQITGIC